MPGFKIVGPVLAITAGLVQAQTPAPPKFEVASIRRCDSPIFRGTNVLEGSSPGGLHRTCVSITNLIADAYIVYPSGRPPTAPPVTIEGGRPWTTSERYEIDARVDGATSLEMMMGPMMQKLLEDRLNLKLHRETRGAISTYALGLAKNGFKLHQLAEGACVSFDVTKPAAEPVPGQRPVPRCDDARLETNTGGIGSNLHDRNRAAGITRVETGSRQGTHRIPGHRSRGEAFRELST